MPGNTAASHFLVSYSYLLYIPFLLFVPVLIMCSLCLLMCSLCHYVCLGACLLFLTHPLYYYFFFLLFLIADLCLCACLCCRCWLLVCVYWFFLQRWLSSAAPLLVSARPPLSPSPSVCGGRVLIREGSLRALWLLLEPCLWLAWLSPFGGGIRSELLCVRWQPLPPTHAPKLPPIGQLLFCMRQRPTSHAPLTAHVQTMSRSYMRRKQSSPY